MSKDIGPEINPDSPLLAIIVTIFFPPIGVFLIAGFGPDLVINIILTLLGFFPGHFHAFYLEYVYFNRRDHLTRKEDAPGIFSKNVKTGGRQRDYGTVDSVPSTPPIRAAKERESLGAGPMEGNQTTAN